MFKAFNKTLNREEWAETANPSYEYICPLCEAEVIPKKGKVRVDHFAHKNGLHGETCDGWSSDTSEWHLEWQKTFPEECREVTVKKELQDGRFEAHRADVLIGDVVIEFQHSTITKTEFDKRNKFYTSCGKRVIWVFDCLESDIDITRAESGIFYFIWSKPFKALYGTIPQIDTSKENNYTASVVVLLQTEKYGLLRADWVIKDDEGGANWCRFGCDDASPWYSPDLYSEDGRAIVFRNPRGRFFAMQNSYRGQYQTKDLKQSCPMTTSEIETYKECRKCPYCMYISNRPLVIYCCYPNERPTHIEYWNR